MIRRSWVFLLVLSLTLSISIPAIYGGMNHFSAVKRIPTWGFLLLLAMVFAGWIFNAARVHLLARNIGARIPALNTLGTVIAAEFAGVASPAGAGAPATYIFLLRQYGLRMGGAAAIVAIDHLTDLIFFFTTIPVALALFLSNGGISHPLRISALVITLMVIGFITLALILRHFRFFTMQIGRCSAYIPQVRRRRFRFARVLVHFQHNVHLLLRMKKRHLLALYIFCVAHWMCRYGILPTLLWIIGESVPWGYLFVAQAILLFVGQVTFLPGGGGGVELGFSALLRPFLDPITTAFTLLVWRFYTFYWFLIIGTPIFLLLTGKMAGRLISLQEKS